MDLYTEANVLVADVFDKFVLELDIMAAHGLVVDMRNRTFIVGNEEILLSVPYRQLETFELVAA